MDDTTENKIEENNNAETVSIGNITIKKMTNEQLIDLQNTTEKIMELLKLPKNWNSYGAETPAQIAADNALALAELTAVIGIPKPVIVPTTSGGIQFEWRVGNVEVEVECLDGGKIAVFVDSGDGDSWIGEIKNVVENKEIIDIIEKNVSYYSKAEVAAMIDDKARKMFNLSGDEVIRKLNNGELKGTAAEITFKGLLHLLGESYK